MSLNRVETVSDHLEDVNVGCLKYKSNSFQFISIPFVQTDYHLDILGQKKTCASLIKTEQRTRYWALKNGWAQVWILSQGIPKHWSIFIFNFPSASNSGRSENFESSVLFALSITCFTNSTPTPWRLKFSNFSGIGAGGAFAFRSLAFFPVAFLVDFFAFLVTSFALAWATLKLLFFRLPCLWTNRPECKLFASGFSSSARCGHQSETFLAQILRENQPWTHSYQVIPLISLYIFEISLLYSEHFWTILISSNSDSENLLASQKIPKNTPGIPRATKKTYHTIPMNNEEWTNNFAIVVQLT